MTNDMKCPHCGGHKLYQLGDGRMKCSACKKKFSPGSRRSRLSPGAMESVVSGFAAGQPASAVAAASGLNLKTVQHYYARFREMLDEDRTRNMSELFGGALVAPELYECTAVGNELRNARFFGCLAARDKEMALFFTDEAGAAGNLARLEVDKVSGWLVAADRQALEALQLDRLFCLPGDHDDDLARSFWAGIKRRLAAYCGGFRAHFRLYLREAEFRENMESPAAAREQIEEMLERNSTFSTGEDDA